MNTRMITDRGIGLDRPLTGVARNRDALQRDVAPLRRSVR